MGVTVHWLEGQIRWGKDHAIYGDDWTTIVTVQRVGTTAHLSGGSGELPPEARREIQQALWREGFRFVSWERSKGGRMQPKTYPIDPVAIGLAPETSGMACALYAVCATAFVIGFSAWKVWA